MSIIQSILRSRLVSRLWWQYAPGEKIQVRWPRGEIIVNHEDPRWVDLGGAVWVNLGFSADPNDHYRHELENLVGTQNWDWGWTMEGNDAAQDRLTIKFHRRHASWASYFAMKWS